MASSSSTSTPQYNSIVNQFGGLHNNPNFKNQNMGTGKTKASMNDYDVIKPLASGSFGQIYLVLHKREKKQYVVKKI